MITYTGSTMATNMYFDGISLGKKFYADTDYVNAVGEEIETVDGTKTIYKATIVNREKSADNKKFILTVTDETETRLSEVKLINITEFEESKSGESEIIIDEEFLNLGAGKRWVKEIGVNAKTAIHYFLFMPIGARISPRPDQSFI